MKTLSLYLVLLSLSVIGCQKDIDEPSVLSAKNTKNCNCKKVKYLPIKVEQGGRVVYFIYLNDEGDLLVEEPTTYVSKYNSDGYPVEIEIKTSSNTYTRKITYKKVILE